MAAFGGMLRMLSETVWRTTLHSPAAVPVARVEDDSTSLSSLWQRLWLRKTFVSWAMLMLLADPYSKASVC